MPSQLIASRLLERHREVARARQDAVAASRAAALATIAERLPGWRVEGHPIGPAMWVGLPIRDAAPFVEHAYGRGCIVNYGGDYRADGRPSQHIRLSLTNDPETTVSLICELAGAWESYLAEHRA